MSSEVSSIARACDAYTSSSEHVRLGGSAHADLPNDAEGPKQQSEGPKRDVSQSEKGDHEQVYKPAVAGCPHLQAAGRPRAGLQVSRRRLAPRVLRSMASPK